MAHTGFARDQPVESSSRSIALDATQRAVLELADGASAAVLGAPGTGKTTTLVELVADRVLRQGWSQDSVLALTTSRASATRLRDTLALRLELPTTGPLARTASSLAFEVVRAAALVASMPPPRLVSGPEQDSILASLLEGHIEEASGPIWPERLGSDVRRLGRFRTELRELMNRATEYDVSAAELRALGAAHAHPEWSAAAELIEEYTEVLSYSPETRLDQAELARFAVRAIERGDAGERIAALRLVVVDDLQEATESMLAILRALASRGVAIVAFGDPDVAANAFRGGEPDALGRLASVLGVPAGTLVLGTGYRQGPTVRRLLDTVRGRIGVAAAGTQRRASVGVADSDRPLATIVAPSVARQWSVAARELREEHLMHGVGYGEMAVLVRSGAQVPLVTRVLALAEVPTRTSVGSTPLRDEPAARNLLTLVRVGIGHAELTPESAIELLVGPFGGLDRLGLRRLRLALRAEELAGGGRRSADELIVDALGSPGRFATIDHRVARAAEKLAETLALLRANDGSIEDLMWLAWERSGLARTWREQALGSGITAAEANRNLDGVLALFTSAKRFAELRPDAPAATYLDDVIGAEIPEDTLSPRAREDAVLVTTPSGAVGLEFDTVIVGGLQEGTWPNLRLRGSLLAPQQLVRVLTGLDAGAIDERRLVLGDELRMFALAITRARRRVILAAVANDDEAASVLMGLVPPGTPALDPAALPLTLRAQVGRLRKRLVATAGRDADAAATLAALAVDGVPGADPVQWHGLAEPSTTGPLFDGEQVPVSPSAIQSLLESPLDWFLERIAGSESGVIAGMGTIIHGAMETASDITVDALWNAVEERWGELLFDAPWLAERQKVIARGFIVALAEYLADFAREGKTLVGAEKRFRMEVGRATLSGSIDRVERHPDGSVVIVDLKTGRVERSQKSIDAHPQLGAYQLAYATGQLDAALDELGEHRAGGAKLLFVKEGVRGKAYREGVQGAFDEAALAEFREQVEKAAALIAAAEFVGPIELPVFGRGDQSGLRLGRVKAVSSD